MKLVVKKSFTKRLALSLAMVGVSSAFAAPIQSTTTATSSWNINQSFSGELMDLQIDGEVGQFVWDLLQKHLNSGNSNRLIKAELKLDSEVTEADIFANNFYCEQYGPTSDANKEFKTRVTSEGIFTENRTQITGGSSGGEGKATAYRLSDDKLLIKLEDNGTPGSIAKLRKYLSNYNPATANIKCDNDSCSFVVTPSGAHKPSSN